MGPYVSLSLCVLSISLSLSFLHYIKIIFFSHEVERVKTSIISKSIKKIVISGYKYNHVMIDISAAKYMGHRV